MTKEEIKFLCQRYLQIDNIDLQEVIIDFDGDDTVNENSSDFIFIKQLNAIGDEPMAIMTFTTKLGMFELLVGQDYKYLQNLIVKQFASYATYGQLMGYKISIQ